MCVFNMKKFKVIITILIAICSFSNSFGMDLKDMLIGQWTVNTSFSNGVSNYMDVLYKENGLCETYLEFTIKQSHTLKANVKERWWIEGDRLFSKVIESSNPELIKIGKKSEVKIIYAEHDIIRLKDKFHSTEYELIRKE